jgi:hypothetical protein
MKKYRITHLGCGGEQVVLDRDIDIESSDLNGDFVELRDDDYNHVLVIASKLIISIIRIDDI